MVLSTNKQLSTVMVSTAASTNDNSRNKDEQKQQSKYYYLMIIFSLFRSARKNPRRLLVLVIAISFSLCLANYVRKRVVVYKKNHKVWAMAPCAFIDRQCPKPPYATADPATTTTPDNNSNKKICLTTLTDAAKGDVVQKMVRARNFDNLLEMTWPNKQAYATKHGYHLFDESSSLDTSRPPSWSKIVAVKRLLTEEHCDWVFWMDADTVIMNANQRIEDFLPLDGTKDLIITDEKNGWYNAGAWLIRNTPWSVAFLDTWWGMDSFVKRKGKTVSGDNEALASYLMGMEKDYFDAHIVVPPRCTFNANALFLPPAEAKLLENGEAKMEDQGWYSRPLWVYHKGDFIAHIAGKDNKIELTDKMLKLAATY